MSWQPTAVDARRVKLSFRAPFGVVLRTLRKESGWTQLSLSSVLHRDHTFVSKSESGTIRPQLDDVERLAAAMSLLPIDRELLIDAWVRSGPDDPPAVAEDLLVSLQAATTLRRLGEPRTAYELAVRDSRRALRRARTARLTDMQLQEVLTVAGELLLEEVKAALDFATGADVRRGLLVVNAREHRLVGAALADRRSRLRLGMAQEAVLYAGGEIEQAHRAAKALFDQLDVNEPEWLAETVRAVAINSGLLGDTTGLAEAWRRFGAVEGTFSGDLRRFTMEGFVRGFTTIEPDQAFQIVDDAYASLAAEGSASVVRRVQLARSEGRLLVHTTGSVGESDSRRRVEEALAQSESLDLSKYVAELEELLGAGSGVSA